MVFDEIEQIAFEPLVPTVGMGATYYGLSDREPYTIVEVVNHRTIRVQQDFASRTDDNGLSKVQEYIYSRNTVAPLLTLTLRKCGKWVEKGRLLSANGFALGHRSKYVDPSF